MTARDAPKESLMADSPDLMLILNAHMDYLGRIDDFIADKRDDPQASTVDSCALGRWYAAVTDEGLLGNPQFAHLGTMHGTFHEMTDAAIAHHRAGDDETARVELDRAYTLFSQISNDLLALDEAA